MRSMEFNMDRAGLLEVGQKVEIREGKLPSAYYYVIEPSIAMSGNFKFSERLKSTTGVVTKITESPMGFHVTAEFDE